MDDRAVNGRDVSFFRENGYWVSPVLLDERRLAECRAAMDRVYAGEFRTGRAPWPGYWQSGDDAPALRKTDNAWWADDVLAALATDPWIGRAAAELMGWESTRLWQDQLLYKPGSGAGDQANIGWHQDWYYWRGAADRPQLCTAWVALDDVDERNGAMQVIPGSHELGLLDGSDFFGHDLQAQLSNLGVKAEPLTLRMPAGAMSFHHVMTLHGSGPNTTSSPRRSLAVHLMDGTLTSKGADDVDFRHYNVRLQEDAGGRFGDAYQGELWPQVYPVPA